LTFGIHDHRQIWRKFCGGKKSGSGGRPTLPDFWPLPDLAQKRGHVNDLALLNLDYFAKVFAKKGKKKRKNELRQAPIGIGLLSLLFW
jgi:hypothetical protein